MGNEAMKAAWQDLQGKQRLDNRVMCVWIAVLALQGLTLLWVPAWVTDTLFGVLLALLALWQWTGWRVRRARKAWQERYFAELERCWQEAK